MIRPLHPSDDEALYDLFSTSTLLTCDYFEHEAGLPGLRSFCEKPPGHQHRLVVLDEGRILGLAILKRSPRPRLAHLGEISLLMPPNHQRQGYGSELLEALVDLAKNWLNLKRLETSIPANEPALIQSFQSAGFVNEGVMKQSLFSAGCFYDEVTLARLSGLEGQELRILDPARPLLSESERQELAGLSIQPMDESHIDDLYEVFRAPENCRTTLQLPSQELWLTSDRVLNPPPNMRRLVAVVSQRVVGMISLRPRTRPCRAHVGGIGMMVHPDYWGQGIGSRLMKEMLNLADHSLKLKRVELIVHTDNPAGIRLYEKSGFVAEGTKYLHTFGGGGWANSLFMARLAQ